MPDYYSPQGNLEVWDEMPEGYFATEEDLFVAHPELRLEDQEKDPVEAYTMSFDAAVGGELPEEGAPTAMDHDNDPSTPGMTRIVFELSTNPGYKCVAFIEGENTNAWYKEHISQIASSVNTEAKVLYWRVLAATDPMPVNDEDLYNDARAAVQDKYMRPFQGADGGIVVMAKMAYDAANMQVPTDDEQIQKLGAAYSQALLNMKNEYAAIDKKFGVA